MSNVVDLMSRRATRGQPVVHFRSAVDALAYASEQIRHLQRLTDAALLIDAEELDLPLAQVAAVLTECIRLHAHIRQENA
jgi:hypothetical protein